MRLTDEMVREDDRRYRSYNVLAELIWCGREVCYRKSITNDNIRFQAWLCRAAADLLKEYQEKQEGLPPAWQDRTQEHICQKCGGIVWQEDNYCSKCGQAVKWT